MDSKSTTKNKAIKLCNDVLEMINENNDEYLLMQVIKALDNVLDLNPNTF